MSLHTYLSICESLIVNYVDGIMVNVVPTNMDKVAFDALRHFIELFEEDIDPNYFNRYDKSV